MKIHDWYTSKYWITRLVRYQQYQNIQEAIESEKRLKWRKRDRKIKLIEEGNPEWIDLSEWGL